MPNSSNLSLNHMSMPPTIKFPERPVSISEIGKSQDYQTVGAPQDQKHLDFYVAT